MLLDARDVSALEPVQRERRDAAITVLDRYIERGVFPRRTSDDYGALRPRFIDDRGVHCAVGEMIAQTGSPELARQINARYEYAFVRDMKSAALLEWANAYGFTVDELAAIQPAYAKPYRKPEPVPFGEEAWIGVQTNVHVLVLGCVGEAPLPEVVELTATRVNGVTHVSAKATDAFSRCFAAAAEKLVDIKHFAPPVVFQIPTLAASLQRRLDVAACVPRRGPMPQTATIDFASGSVATEPANEDANACLAEQLGNRVWQFGRRVKVKAKIELPAQITTQRARKVLVENAPNAAWKCVAHGDPAQITVIVRARTGDDDFAITIPGANTAFSACLSASLVDPLRGLLRRSAAHRVDSDIDASLTFKLVH